MVFFENSHIHKIFDVQLKNVRLYTTIYQINIIVNRKKEI